MRRTPPVSARRLASLVRDFPKRRLLVVGDAILDRFIWGDVERISPEAPVPVVRVASEELRPGGAANVAANIQALGGRAVVGSVVGADDAGRWLTARLEAAGALTQGIFPVSGVRTTEKSRVMGRPRLQQIVRLDYEGEKTVPHHAARRLRRFVEQQAPRVDGIVVSDYGRGNIDPEMLDLIGGLAGSKGVLAVVDPRRDNYEHYRDVTLVTPNQAEAADASGVAIDNRASLRRAAATLLEKWRCKAILVTLGPDGMSLFRRDGSASRFPAAARQVFDVTGAGDTVAATCTLALAAGGSFEEAATLGNLAAGTVVGRLGTVPADLRQLRSAIRGVVKGNRRGEGTLAGGL